MREIWKGKLFLLFFWQIFCQFFSAIPHTTSKPDLNPAINKEAYSDYVNVAISYDKPKFCISIMTADDGRSGKYIGLGYSFDIDGHLEGKENTYHSEIAQGGTNLSCGQRQRMAIARAVMKKPQIYLLDDSFSALDMKTDK